MPLCSDLVPPLYALIREFYSNLSTHSDEPGGHYLTIWIRGEEFKITKQMVLEALSVPLFRRPTYPYTESPLIYDVMTLFCQRFVTWGTEPRLNSYELTEYNYMLFRIACHNLFPISHVYTIPIDKCVFLYALSIDGSICFLSLFIQIIVVVHRSTSRKHHLFFPIFTSRVLTYLELEDFLASDSVHIIAPIGSSFLRQWQAQKNTVKPSVGSSKRPQVVSIVGDLPIKEIPIDPTVAIAEDGVDEVNVETGDAEPIVPPPLSLFMS